MHEILHLRCYVLASLHFRRDLPALITQSRTVSYYAFFKGWLLLSQPPVCLRQSTTFPT